MPYLKLIGVSLDPSDIFGKPTLEDFLKQDHPILNRVADVITNLNPISITIETEKDKSDHAKLRKAYLADRTQLPPDSFKIKTVKTKGQPMQFWLELRGL